MPTSDFLKEKYKGKSLTPQADVERLINSAQRWESKWTRAKLCSG